MEILIHIGEVLAIIGMACVFWLIAWFLNRG